MQKVGVWAGLAFLVLAGIVFWQSLGLSYRGMVGVGPGLLPLWLSIILGVLSVIYTILSFKKSLLFNEILPKTTLREFLIVIGSMVLFVALINRVGFIIAGTLMLAALFFREYKWYWTLAISIMISVITYLMFTKGFGILLPTSRWGW